MRALVPLMIASLSLCLTQSCSSPRGGLFAPKVGWDDFESKAVDGNSSKKSADPAPSSTSIGLLQESSSVKNAALAAHQLLLDTRSAGEIIDAGLNDFFDHRSKTRKRNNLSLDHRTGWQDFFLSIDSACEKQPLGQDLSSFIRVRMALDVESVTDQRRGRELGERFENEVQARVDCVHDRVIELRAMGALGTIPENLPPLILGSMNFSLPVVPMVISSPFGVRTDPFTKRRRFHAGVDVSAPFGTDVVTVLSGTIVYAGLQGGYGNHVVVEHGNGLRTHYSHLRRIVVETGQKVNKGQRIATVGATGRATGPHLHFAVSNNDGQFIDPLDIIERGLVMKLEEAPTE